MQRCAVALCVLSSAVFSQGVALQMSPDPLPVGGTLSVTLTPPRTGGVTPESVEDDARALADMIQAAAQELGEALKGDPPLGVSELSATLRFQVVSALGGKVGFKILGHGVSVGARGQEADVQKLTVTLSES